VCVYGFAKKNQDDVISPGRLVNHIK